MPLLIIQGVILIQNIIDINITCLIMQPLADTSSNDISLSWIHLLDFLLTEISKAGIFFRFQFLIIFFLAYILEFQPDSSLPVLILFLRTYIQCLNCIGQSIAVITGLRCSSQHRCRSFDGFCCRRFQYSDFLGGVYSL